MDSIQVVVLLTESVVCHFGAESGGWRLNSRGMEKFQDLEQSQRIV